MVDREIVGQALYTWSLKPLGTGRPGYGFVDISPAWTDNLAWLDATTKSLTGFMRQAQTTDEERARYRPLGRHVHTRTALVYRKYHVGQDGYDRPGNYAAHFFIAPMRHIGITDALRIRDELWYKGTGVYGPSWEKLADLDLSDFHAKMRPTIETGHVDSKRIIAAIGQIVEEGSVNVSDWNTAEIASLTGTLPCWADYAMSMTPEWTSKGPSLTIAMPLDATDDPACQDRRLDFVDEELADLRKRLNTAASLPELKSILSPRSRGSGRAASTPPERLEDCVMKWVREGTKSMTPKELTLLEENPLSTFVALDKLGRRLPSARKPDTFILGLLNRCGSTIDGPLLGRILPAEDEIAGLYAGASTNGAVLEAVVRLNADDRRSIDIVLRRAIPDIIINLLVETSKTDESLMKGLVRSVKLSSLGEGSFARQLFSADTADWDHLYATILPAAADGRADSLLSLACVNPEKFVSWINVPEPYAAALTDMLRHETQQAVWERISALLGRWRKR